MGIILCEAANTHKTVKRTGKLVPVNKAEFAHAKRQILIGMHLRFINEHAAGAVHRLNCIILIVDNGGVHILFIVIPVTAALPKRSVKNHRGLNFIIACLAVNFAPIINKRVFQHHALRQEERETGAFFHNREEPKLLAELSVITLFGFFKHCKVFLKH